MFSPLKYISPPVILPGSVNIRRIEYAVTLLPEPLSPTMPSVFPISRLNEMPFTAWTTPCSVGKEVLRF